ncbi:MAG: ATP-binding cassette domain-containing protein [Chthonomonadales bacterium]
MISLSGVSKRYGDQVALETTDINFETGITSALIGPSGCGKSTILRLTMGLIPPTTGSIKIADELMTPTTAIKLRQKIGYVNQDGGLFPHLTAERNATLMARYLGQTETSFRLRLVELAQLVRFPVDLLARYPLELSGGQRQRVGIMRALMLDPELLLLDEPMGALDPLVRAGLQDDLKSICAKLGKTVILVTHDMAEAAYLAQTIVILNQGAVVQNGTLEDLKSMPASTFVTEFLHSQRGLDLL